MTPQVLFTTLLIVGLLMVGAEVFIPGGVLGTIGGMLLMAAVFMAFSQGVQVGVMATVGIVILLALVIMLWIRVFPRTGVGRRMTVSQSLAGARGGGEYAHLIGMEGVARSGLRPGGFAEFDGQRLDVVADGEWIETGARIRVLDVKGNRIVVQKVGSETKEG